MLSMILWYDGCDARILVLSDKDLGCVGISILGNCVLVDESFKNRSGPSVTSTGKHTWFVDSSMGISRCCLRLYWEVR